MVEPEVPEVDPALEAREQATSRALRHRAEIFVELSKTDAFRELMLEKARKRKRMDDSFAATVRAGQEINQRQVDYDRGFIDGLDYLDQVMKAAENHLARLDRAVIQPEQEEEDDF